MSLVFAYYLYIGFSNAGSIIYICMILIWSSHQSRAPTFKTVYCWCTDLKNWLTLYYVFLWSPSLLRSNSYTAASKWKITASIDDRLFASQWSLLFWPWPFSVLSDHSDMPLLITIEQEFPLLISHSIKIWNDRCLIRGLWGYQKQFHFEIIFGYLKRRLIRNGNYSVQYIPRNGHVDRALVPDST